MNHAQSLGRRTPSPCPGNYGSTQNCEHAINTDPSDVRPNSGDAERNSLHSTGSFRMGESEDGRLLMTLTGLSVLDLSLS